MFSYITAWKNSIIVFDSPKECNCVCWYLVRLKMDLYICFWDLSVQSRSKIGIWAYCWLEYSLQQRWYFVAYTRSELSTFSNQFILRDFVRCINIKYRKTRVQIFVHVKTPLSIINIYLREKQIPLKVSKSYMRYTICKLHLQLQVVHYSVY